MIIDTKLAIEKSNNNIELAKELFTMLIKDLPQSLESIKSSYRSESKLELLDHAHRLHGSTAYCGVPNLKIAASKLEEYIKSNDTTEMQSYINDVEFAVNDLIQNAPKILNSSW
jgi:two-component system sensor histidine kinase BarA